jgi:hypothetical protein
MTRCIRDLDIELAHRTSRRSADFHKPLYNVVKIYQALVEYKVLRCQGDTYPWLCRVKVNALHSLGAGEELPLYLFPSVSHKFNHEPCMQLYAAPDLLRCPSFNRTLISNLMLCGEKENRDYVRRRG